MYSLTTKKYEIIFKELERLDTPKGFESVLYDNVGEPIDNSFYEIFNDYKNVPLFVKNKQFDSGRNLRNLVNFLKKPKDCGIVSGRKPSGACHFGHKLVIEALKFFQDNNVQIFIPIADLEASLDPKIKNKEQYQYLTADNLIDWGACGLNLDASHVYLQSEEIRVMNLAYALARGLTFDKYIDIYGRETVTDEFCFLFATITQVGDINLPQHKDFNKKHSFMVSGVDQDGHMNLTLILSKEIVNKGLTNTIPSSLYVRTVSNLKGKKESASEPETTLYLGSLRNLYSYKNGKKTLEYIRKLSLEERIKDVNYKIDKFTKENKELVIESIERRKKIFPEFEDVNTIDDFKNAIKDYIIEHQKRREEVFKYAVLKSYEDGFLSKHEIKKLGIKKDEPEPPYFWNKSIDYIPEDKKLVKTKWYHQIAKVYDKIVV